MKGPVFVFLLLSLSTASAQRNFGTTVQLVRVRATFADGTCDSSAHVTLSAHNGVIVEGSQNGRCETAFADLPEGNYQVNVLGKNLARTDANSKISVSSSGPAEFDVQLRRTTIFDQGSIPGSSFVSVSDLAVPIRARKELDKAVEMIRKQDLQRALEKLNKAITIHPQYALAYNNLGAIYSRLGDLARENDALQKAISLDPNLELAYLNLARLDLREGQYPAAEAALDRAVALNSHDPVAMVLLSYAEFMDRAYGAAIATSRKAHLLEQPHATAHRVAAFAFEMENQGRNAISELETFLQEQPFGPQADETRKEIAALKTVLHSSDAQ